MTRLILLACILCGNLFAALPADTVWEVRPTNGSNLNGGAYEASIADGNSVDYSQQDAAQLSVTDLVNVGAVTTCTSVAGGFTDAMQGNFLHLESGTNVTVGFYAITEVTDANTIVLDRSPGNTIVTGTGKIGGATKSLSGQTTNKLAGALLEGHKVWVKNEAWDESVTGFPSLSSTGQVTIEGYNSARGDEPTGTNRPLNDRNSAGIPFTCAGANAGWVFKHLRATRSSGAGFSSTNSTHIFINCHSYNNAAEGFLTTVGVTYFGCEASGNTTAGFGRGTTSPYYFGCYSHDNTTAGFLGTTGSPSYRFCIAEANAASGIQATTFPFGIVLNCTLDGNTGASSDGLQVTLSNIAFVVGNIISNNGRYGVSASAGNSYYADYNNYYQNSTAPRSNLMIGTHDTALDPAFVNAAGGNFSPGTNMKATGFPGLFPGGTSQGYLDQGAVQRQEGGGASSSTF